MSAGQLLEQGVGVGDRRATGDDLGADDGLDRLGEDLPVHVEVGEQDIARQRDRVQPAAQVVDREQRVSEGHTDVALGGRVREVALQAAGHQSLTEGREQSARDLEVRLGVLEADRVDLVRHGRRSGRAGDGDLREVAERDVRPDVGREIVQDAAGMADPVVQLDLPVVGFDLRGEQIEAESEALDVLAGDGGPVGVGVGRQVRGPGARRPRELCEVVGCRDLGAHALETPCEDGDLLAHGRRRRGLAVRA
ncbi:hypothetical protein SRABI03_03388 [Microbacterium foliorum]|nr:hypothetical protein SRABI03_03388 [Microbacterium foliorum]